jgi:hypothetical protein
MQVWHAGHSADAWHRRDLFELLQGLALDPGSGRGEKVNRRDSLHRTGIAHDATIEEMGLTNESVRFQTAQSC